MARQNGRYFAYDIFKSNFLNENIWISWIDISLIFVYKCPINNIPALGQIIAWRRPGDKPLPEAMMISLLTHICVPRPQWIKIETLLSLAAHKLIVITTSFSVMTVSVFSVLSSVLLSVLPQSRPNFSRIQKSLQQINPSTKSVMDCMMERLEQKTVGYDFTIKVTSWLPRWRHQSPARWLLFAQPCVQAQIKENIKSLRHRPLWGESAGDRWIPLIRDQ